MPMSISEQRSNFRVTCWESVVILVVIGAGETWPGVWVGISVDRAAHLKEQLSSAHGIHASHNVGTEIALKLIHEPSVFGPGTPS